MNSDSKAPAGRNVGSVRYKDDILIQIIQFEKPKMF